MIDEKEVQKEREEKKRLQHREAAKRYEAKLKDSGFVRITVRVPVERKQFFLDLSKKVREAQ